MPILLATYDFFKPLFLMCSNNSCLSSTHKLLSKNFAKINRGQTPQSNPLKKQDGSTNPTNEYPYTDISTLIMLHTNIRTSVYFHSSTNENSMISIIMCGISLYHIYFKINNLKNPLFLSTFHNSTCEFIQIFPKFLSILSIIADYKRHIFLYHLPSALHKTSFRNLDNALQLYRLHILAHQASSAFSPCLFYCP